jgi:hypothetical protein
MHTEIAKVYTIQKKYVLLREFAKPNQEWADKADYIFTTDCMDLTDF